jgi:hypothetical protein
MPKPWFQPKGLLNYRSLTWQGRAVVATTWLIVLFFGSWSFFYTEPESTAWWVTAAVAFVAFLIGHSIVLWKMDWGYGRR